MKLSDRGHKHLLQIQSLFGTGLEVRHIPVSSAPRLHVEIADSSHGQVTLVADDEEREIVADGDVRVVEELFAPHGQVAETGEAVESEGEQADMGASVEVLPQSLEALPATRVHQVEGVVLVVHRHLSLQLFNEGSPTDVGVKRALDKTPEDRGLADTHVS